jgi:bifunctional UDP-N-acetylglucosamine pyrophosphorylase/glucosamine-1-phosphate N-acetyltransferase
MGQALSIIILCAGKGTRMKSSLPKVMHKIAGRRMIDMVIDEAIKLDPMNITLVISQDILAHRQEIIDNHKSKIKLDFVVQENRLGTGNAVDCGLKYLKNSSQEIGKKVLILYGDTPLISCDTLKKMLDKLVDSSLCVLAFEDEEENSYGRLIIDDTNHLQQIVEFKDANPDQRKIGLCNSGVVGVDGRYIEQLISQVKNDNSAKEFYLTDIVSIASDHGLKRSFIKTNSYEVLGVNSRSELAEIEKIKQKQLRKKMLENGVTLIAPKTVFFNFDTEIASDVVIQPNVIFGEGVKIESNVEIKSFCNIEGAFIKSNTSIGPFARIRSGTVIEENSKVGNFVEIKKSQIKKGTKINHLSYVGDAEIGENSNLGAGTITCNYDGYNKFKTVIGENVFIGSNTALIAPINIGDNAVIGAGSVITKNVNADDLAISRAKQQNLENGGKNFHHKKTKK